MSLISGPENDLKKMMESVEELVRERNAFLQQRDVLAEALKDRGVDPEMVLKNALEANRAIEKAKRDT